jgi:non-specific serine/threonine protein kinase/serine/threonine-protein kinase
MLTPERWQQVRRVLDAALDAPPAERSRRVRDACGADQSLCREALSLLEFADSGEWLIDRPAPATLQADEELAEGARLGPYRVERLLDRGGMGGVYLASRDDGTFRGQVAIKIVEGGRGGALLRRFESERQILATLAHPNVARLLDAGSAPDGRPYLVMEHVDGPPIDRWCEERALPLRDRLLLFRQVCAAVMHAHRRLVVHRDIKPGNVLVGADGVPKLLDFGIAKLLSAEPGLTATQAPMMTPHYAAPEQVEGGPVTTATDVYALGLLLYELLTGRKAQAVDDPTPVAVLRAVVERDPTRPSLAAPADRSRALEGDLDAIVLTALRKEPERRYASVEQLDDDVRRHLEGLPVAAVADRWSYRLGKLVHRHRVAAAAAGLALVAVVGGAGVALWQARVAEAERARAERRLEDVRRLAHAMLFDVHDELDRGPVKTRQLLARRATEYLDRLAAEADDPVLQRELAAGYLRLGKIQGAGLTSGQLGDAAAAEHSFARARALHERVLAVLPQDFESRREIAHLDWLAGRALLGAGKPTEAIARLTSAAAALQALLRERPDDGIASEHLGEAWYGLVLAYGNNAVAGVGRRDEARRVLDLALPLAERLARERPDDEHRSMLLSSLRNELATWHRFGGDLETAARILHERLREGEEILRRHPESRMLRRELAAAYGNAAAIDVARKDHAALLDHTGKALPLFEALAAEDPANANVRQDLAVGHRNHARALTLAGELPAARRHLDAAIGLFRELAKLKPDDVFVARQIAFTHLVASDTVNRLQGPAAALRELEQGARLCDALVAKSPDNATAWRTLAQIAAEGADIGTRGRLPAATVRAWHARARDAWLGLQKVSGALAPPDQARLDAATKALAALPPTP